MRHANIGRIDVPVDVVIGHVPMSLLANIIREPTYGQQVGSLVQRNTISKREAFPGLHPFGDRLQRSIVNDQLSHDIFCSLAVTGIFAGPSFPCAELRRVAITFSVSKYAKSSNSPQRRCGSPEQQEQHTNISVHGEKCSVQLAEIVCS